jgi:hypothetical protein
MSRENLMVTDFDTAKELVGRIVAQAVEFPTAAPTLNNANIRGAFTPLTPEERARCMAEQRCFNCR